VSHSWGSVQECLNGQQNRGFRLITSQSNSGNQRKRAIFPFSFKERELIHTPSHSLLENTYLLESDEFAYAPIEQLILNQLLCSSRKPFEDKRRAPTSVTGSKLSASRKYNDLQEAGGHLSPC
jgi:hypothetical protein